MVMGPPFLLLTIVGDSPCVGEASCGVRISPGMGPRVTTPQTADMTGNSATFARVFAGRRRTRDTDLHGRPDRTYRHVALTTKASIKMAQDLLDRFFRDAEGKT